MTPCDPYMSSNPPGLAELISGKGIFIAGAGGLGSNAASMLVRAGANRLTIIDHDIVEPSNLNRQFYFRHQVGRPKVEALRENLLEINPDISVCALREELTFQNAKEMIRTHPDVVLECFDRPESKATIASYCLKNLPSIPLVTVSGIAGCGPLSKIRLYSPRPDMFVIGDLQSEAGRNTGTLSSRITFAAAMQAHIAILLLAGRLDDIREDLHQTLETSERHLLGKNKNL
ncbi:MAG: sulfur carrier protein ThiS adenylyltransferase ThiF [Victivallales bacterium]|nr:sulfur carrier protein ThiS adenylyltransferase ThiF [Victivallales bacterium]